MDFVRLANQMAFGRRLYAHGKWWTRLQELHRGYYLVIERDVTIPAQVAVVLQTDTDKRYQDILFKKFALKKPGHEFRQLLS